ncbi:MAG TPA: glycosyltransferase family 2 protein [Aurantimonas coralicida]|nr:glycosyltransferase family 2 protein [Aurantimonas coralicida]HEU03024.1 glycosyltransferase family 2 protein [Aurantimonas coralicida]
MATNQSASNVARKVGTGRAFALVSIVVPARNEAENLAVLLREVEAALAARALEIVVVDDGSTDATALTLATLRADGVPLRHIRHNRPAGQSRAIRSGVLAASGDLVVTIDGDGQNDPAFIPALVAALESTGPTVGLAAGQRTARTDTKLKQLSSRFANGLRTAILKDATRDTGCGLKAIPTELFRRLPYFDGWHRYLPALVLREGLTVVHIDVKDRQRRFGRSNYGIFDRGLRGILDLFGVWWLRRRALVRPDVSEIIPDQPL